MMLLALLMTSSLALLSSAYPHDANPLLLQMEHVPGEELMENEDLFEGDIKLTPEQQASMGDGDGEDDDGDDRSGFEARKAYPSRVVRWPNHTVHYRFADGESFPDKAEILKGIQDWADHTCLDFVEVASNYDLPHILFRAQYDGCWSYVGFIGRPGQVINLDPSGCQTAGITAHEIGHAIGFFHEQSRSDRDQFIRVFPDAIATGMASQFRRESTNNFGVPYDYSSVMHYPATAFSKEGFDTIVALKPFGQRLIGNREKLSHMDLLLTHRMYECQVKFGPGCSDKKCGKFGVLLRNCSCHCPPGTTGGNCETVTSPVVEALTQNRYPLDKHITAPSGSVSSLGQTGSMFLYFRAPPCHVINITLDAANDVDCSNNIITVRHPADSNNKITLCFSQAQGPHHFSANTLDLVYHNPSVPREMRATWVYEQVCGDTAPPPPPTGTPTVVPSTPSPPPRPPKAMGLNHTGLGDCRWADRFSSRAAIVRNPLRNKGVCNITYYSSGPSTLLLKLGKVALDTTDTLEWVGPLGLRVPITNEMAKQKVLLPTSVGRLEFQSAGARKKPQAFRIMMRLRPNRCQMFVRVFPTVKSAMYFPKSKTKPYLAKSYCQWWLHAPEGYRIALTFKVFTMGNTTTPGCENSDFLAIDPSGDPHYTNAMKACGGPPRGVLSDANVMTVMGYGHHGGSGFIAFYVAVKETDDLDSALDTRALEHRSRADYKELIQELTTEDQKA